MGHFTKEDEFLRTTNPIQRMSIGDQSPELKAIALQVFGSRDGMTPLFPRSGELIQEAMKRAYELGKSERS